MKSYQFNSGYARPSFARNSRDGIIELTNPSVLVTDAILSTAEDILTCLAFFWEAAAPLQPPFLVIARGFDEATLNYLASLNARGLPIYVVKAPGYGDRCKEILIDIATLTGGFIFPDKGGFESGQIGVGELGRAEKIIISAESTCIYGGAGSIRALMDRIAKIQHEIETSRSDSNREKL